MTRTALLLALGLGACGSSHLEESPSGIGSDAGLPAQDSGSPTQDAAPDQDASVPATPDRDAGPDQDAAPVFTGNPFDSHDPHETPEGGWDINTPGAPMPCRASRDCDLWSGVLANNGSHPPALCIREQPTDSLGFCFATEPGQRDPDSGKTHCTADNECINWNVGFACHPSSKYCQVSSEDRTPAQAEGDQLPEDWEQNYLTCECPRHIDNCPDQQTWREMFSEAQPAVAERCVAQDFWN